MKNQGHYMFGIQEVSDCIGMILTTEKKVKRAIRLAQAEVKA